MTSKEIRQSYADCQRERYNRTCSGDEHIAYWTAASASFLAEIAAQLAELNESHKPQPPRSRFEGL